MLALAFALRAAVVRCNNHFFPLLGGLTAQMKMKSKLKNRRPSGQKTKPAPSF